MLVPCWTFGRILDLQSIQEVRLPTRSLEKAVGNQVGLRLEPKPKTKAGKAKLRG